MDFRGKLFLAGFVQVAMSTIKACIDRFRKQEPLPPFLRDQTISKEAFWWKEGSEKTLYEEGSNNERNNEERNEYEAIDEKEVSMDLQIKERDSFDTRGDLHDEEDIRRGGEGDSLSTSVLESLLRIEEEDGKREGDDEEEAQRGSPAPVPSRVVKLHLQYHRMKHNF